jgi:hypothetical protein
VSVFQILIFIQAIFRALTSSANAIGNCKERISGANGSDGVTNAVFEHIFTVLDEKKYMLDGYQEI